MKVCVKVNNLGHVYKELGEEEKSVEYFHKLLSLLWEINQYIELGGSTYNPFYENVF